MSENVSAELRNPPSRGFWRGAEGHPAGYHAPHALQFCTRASRARCSHVFPRSARDYNKLPSLFPDMIESRLIDPRAPSPRLEISQRGAARIDTGRSNKAGRLRGHRGAAHTVTPAITTTGRPPTPPERTRPDFTACLIY